MIVSQLFTQLSPDDLRAMISNAVTDGITEGLRQFQERQPKPQAEELLTREEAAKLLRVSLVTIYQRMKSKDIPFRRVGRRVLIPKNELLAKLAEQKRGR